MRKSLIVLVLLGILSSNAQVINIPDANFKAVLLAADYNISIAGTGDISDISLTKIDLNNNGEIEVSEVQQITYLYIAGSNISSLSGIEYFINLKYFFCHQNNLVQIDEISNLTYLDRIICGNNLINNINLTNLTNLVSIDCRYNFINSIDFSNNPELKVAYCGNNQLTSLDFSANPSFHELGCKNNPNLTELNIKNNLSQSFGTATILNECWTGCPSLSRICADSFELGALQTYLNDCGISTAGMVLTSTCALGTPSESLAQFAVYPNPSRGQCTVSFESLLDTGTIEVFSLVGQRLAEVPIDHADQVTVQLPNLAAGCYLVKVTSNGQTIQKRIIIE